MKYVFDLDGTICTQVTDGDYPQAQPIPAMVNAVRDLRAAGHYITIHTARGSETGIDWRDLTETQLAAWGVPYDRLMLGKPFGEVYVDDRAMRPDEWLAAHHPAYSNA